MSPDPNACSPQGLILGKCDLDRGGICTLGRARYAEPKTVKTRQDTKTFPAAGQPELRGPIAAHASTKIRILRINGTQGRLVVSLATVLGSQSNRALKGDNLDIPASTKSRGKKRYVDREQ